MRKWSNRRFPSATANARAPISPCGAWTMPTRKGWSFETLEALGVGYDGERYTIPTSAGVLRYRDHDGKGPKMLAERGKPRVIWPAPDTVAGETLVVVEGEPDAISARELAISAVALPGAGKADPDWPRQLAAGRARVVFVCDADATGRTRMRNMAGKVAALGVEASVIDPAPERDDGYD